MAIVPQLHYMLFTDNLYYIFLFFLYISLYKNKIDIKTKLRCLKNGAFVFLISLQNL